MRVKPFRGWRPRPDLADRIPSPPYDVLADDEARAIAREEPHSFVRVIRAEVDLEPDLDPHDARVYAQAARNFRAMGAKGWLVRDATPAFYVYRLTMDGRSQTGILGLAAVRDYLEERILRHEHTRPDKEDDRVRLNTAIGANPGPVFLTHRDAPALEALGKGVTGRPPAVRFVAPDRVEHELWVVSDEVTRRDIETRFEELERTYIADGHHRAAAAARVGAPDGSFLAAHFPSRELRVLDYNRLVRDLCGMDEAALLRRIRDARFRIADEHRERRPPRRGTFGMYLRGRWRLLAVDPDDVPQDDPVGRLDVSILTDRLLRPILEIADPRTDPRIGFVGGIRGMEELERRVDAGEAAVAFALHPTSLDDVLAVADAGVVMPPKSTWFEPKLRSGMVVQTLDE